ncbi:MAG: regulatory protein RecX [Burkholderiales bacterium]|nr:regulatory protein RecX [Burkholderiales bacterium]
MASKDRDDVDKADGARKLRNKALRLLTTREHSREELLRKLAQSRQRRAVDNDAMANGKRDDVERLLDELAAAGWQSDERYAEAMVRRLTGQASRRYIEEKLAQAGIKKEAARLALDALEQDDGEIAFALWQRRFGGEPPADDKDRQRQIRFLLTRGFHLGDAFKIVPQPVEPGRARQGGLASRAGRQTPAGSDTTLADSTIEPELFGEPPTPMEYTRTSSQRLSEQKYRSFGHRQRGELKRHSLNSAAGPAGEPTTPKSEARSSFKSAVRRARPWGARNDADPSDE